MKNFWAEEFQNQRKANIRKLIIFLCFLAVILAIVVLIFVYMYNLRFRTWCDNHILIKNISEDSTKTIDIEEDENVQIYAYDKYLCILRKKVLEFYNKTGSKVGSIELDINKVEFASAGSYLAISEDGGQKFYLINGREKVFENQVEGTINQINVSEAGYVSIVMSNSNYKSIIDVYDRSGTEIFKTNLVSSRVVDVSISQDSKYLAIAEVNISGVVIQSNIQVVSIELAKSDPKNAILYKYDAPKDKLILSVRYQKNDNLICMYNDSIEILKDEQSSQILDAKNKSISFMTIDMKDKVVSLEEKSTGDYNSETCVNIINPANLKVRQYVTNDVAKSIKTSEDKIAINFGTELHIINKNGILLKKYISNSEVNDIVMTKNIVGIIYRDRIQIIKI